MINRILATTAIIFVYCLSFGQATADFTHNFDPNSGNSCAPISVSFADASTNATTYSWTIDGTPFSTSDSPARSFAVGGSYNICLTVSDGGTPDQHCEVLDINQQAIISIPTTPTSNCAPYTTSIDFVSTKVLTTATVDYGDGIIEVLSPNATTFSASHTYSQEGNFSITISAVDINGCTSIATKSNVVTVRNVNNLGFNVDLSSCVVPLTATFINTTPNPGNYLFTWDYGDGSAGATGIVNASNDYNNNGAFDVTLSAIDNLTGCTDSYTINDAINAQTVTTIQALEYDNNDCGSTAVAFSLDNAPENATLLWDFGDGNDSTEDAIDYTYTTAGSFIPSVEITTTAGCIFTVTYGSSISVLGPTDPSFTITGDQATCNETVGTTVTLTANPNSATSVSWNFGDGQPFETGNSVTHTYTDFGNYRPILTSTYANGCIETYSSNGLTIDIETSGAILIPDTTKGCVPFDVSFEVVGVNDPIASVDWDFGFTTASGLTTTTTYGAAQVGIDHGYTAVVTTTTGCVINAIGTQPIEAGDVPNVDFSVDTLASCVDSPLQFTDQSENTVDQWEWDFGIGSSTQQNPVHQYTEPDSFQVTLKAWYNGCPAEYTDSNYIQIGEPKAGFQFEYHCTDLNTINFTDNSTGADSVWWDFGDGSAIQYEASPSHTFAGENTYTVTQYVKNTSTGCLDEEESTINLVNPFADFDFRDTIICLGGPTVVIPNLGTAVYNVSWEIFSTTGFAVNSNSIQIVDDGSSGQNFSFNILQPGTYDRFVMNYTLELGCTEIRSVTFNAAYEVEVVQVALPPGAIQLSGCLPAAISITNNSFPPPFLDPAAIHEWQIEKEGILPVEDTLIYGYNPTYAFESTGTYGIKYKITTSNQCVASTNEEMYVIVDTLEADFNWSVANCNQREIQFENNTSTLSPSSYEWDFGDGNTSTSPTPLHQYASDGDYTVRFIANSFSGCTDTVYQTISVFRPVADFLGNNLTQSCPIPALFTTFTNTSIGGSSYEWDFGDGGTSTLVNPSHGFGTIDSFNIQLVVTSALGCTDTITKVNYIQIGGPNAQLAYTTTQSCTGSDISFVVQGDGLVNYTLNFGDGNLTSITPTGASDTITYAYAVPGSYEPILIAEDVSGCRVSYVGQDSITVFDLVTDFDADMTQMCSNDLLALSFTANISNPSAVDSVRWFFPGSDTPTSTGTIVGGINYTAEGLYDVTMITYTPVCTDTITKTDYIEVLPPPTFTMPSDETICAGSPIDLIIPDAGVLIFSWDNGASLSCDDCPNPTATPTTLTTYTATGSNGVCASSGSVTISVNVATFDAIPENASVCFGQNIPATLPATATNISWTSTPNLVLSCTDCLNQQITANATGDVTVTYDYEFCTITEVLSIDVWDPNSVSESANTRNICPGDLVSLNDNYPGVVSWRAGDINSAPLVTTTVSPTQDTRYYIEVLNNGCPGVDSFDITIALPSLMKSADQTICLGDSIPLSVLGGPLYSYDWALTTPPLSCSNCPDPIAKPTTTTTYFVTASNPTGCSVTDSITITVNDITPDEAPDDLNACKDSVVTITLPNNLSNVVWASALPISNTNGLTTDVTASTDGSVDVTYELDFCVITETINVNIWDPTSVEAPADTITCSGDAVVLPRNYPGTTIWRAGSPTGTIINIDTVYPINDIQYFLEVINHGCSATDAFNVTINRPSISVSPDTTICIGTSTQIEVFLDPTFAIFGWDNTQPGLNCYNCLTPDAMPTVTTAYVVSATNDFGCTTQDTVVVTVNDSIPNLLPDVSEVCLNDSVPFAITDPTVTNIVWSSTLPYMTTNGDREALVSATDTNIVTVTYDWNACSYTEVIQINAWNPLSVDAGQDQHVCLAEQVVLPLNYPGNAITWRENSSTAAPLASNIVNPIVATTYFVEVQYNNCSAIDSFNVTIDEPVITAAVTDSVICLGTSTSLTVSGELGNTYSWFPTIGLDCDTCTTVIATPTANIDYTVTAINTNNCSVSEVVSITVNDPQIQILDAVQDVCLNDTAQINITPPAGVTNIQWSSATLPLTGCLDCNNPTFTAIDTGRITLTYDYQTCSFTEEIFIDTWDPRTVNAGVDTLICLGDTISLTSNYPPGSTYEWREGSLNAIPLFTDEAHPDTSTWYYLSITNHGCTGVDSVFIRIDQPSIQVDQPSPICVGSSVQLYVRGATGEAYTFDWIGQQQGLSCTDCEDPVALPPFTSTYTVVGTNPNGCSVEEDVTVQVDQDTVNLIETDTLFACIGRTLSLDITGNPGVDVASIFWNTTLPISCQCETPTFSVDSSASLILTYNYNTCSVREEVYVVAWDPNSVDAGPDQTICAGDEISLDNNYPGTVNWYFNSMNSASLTGSSDIPTQSGRYYIRVDNNNCFGIDSMDVIVRPNADISGGSYEICVGDSMILDVVGDADSIVWNNANSLSDDASWNPTAFPTVTTTYTIQGFNNGCAADTAVVSLVVHENPAVEIRLPTTFIEGDEIRLQADVNATDDLDYFWSPADAIDCTTCQLPLFRPTETTLVQLTVQDQNTQCVATDTATIVQEFVCSDNSIVMASAFSPNGDGVNDHITPVSLNEITAVKIFNRWGELVFESDGQGLGWDGRYGGLAIKKGVYVWVAEGVCRFDGRPLKGSGDFTLIR